MSSEDADGLDVWLDEVDTDEERTGPPSWQSGVLGIVAVTYLAVAVHGVFVVTGDLLGWAGDNAFAFPGSAPSSGRQDLRGDLLALTVRGVAVAAVGGVLGFWWRRRLAATVSGGAAVVALVVGLTTYAMAAEDRPARPAWEDDGPRGCVELSGEPSDCP